MAVGYHGIFQAIGSYDAATRAFTAGSLNANVTSGATHTVGAMLNASATVWVESGTPSGTFYVDVTNDKRADDAGSAANAKWVTVTSVTYTAGVDPNGNSASQIVWVNGSKWARLRWVNTGGTGTGGAMLTGVSGS